MVHFDKRKENKLRVKILRQKLQKNVFTLIPIKTSGAKTFLMCVEYDRTEKLTLK